MRPIGAFIFGRLADRYGRRPVLMFDVLCYSGLAFASAFAPSFAVFLILRVLFGIAMGGEWGVGASLTMESVRPESRGVVSGILQSGYASGYLVASIAFGVLYPLIGWRGMFMVGVLPALLVLYIRRSVPESPGWNERHARSVGVGTILKRHWRLALYMILLMTGAQFPQPRHAGPLSDVPAQGVEVRSAHGQLHRHHLQSRRHRGRVLFGFFSQAFGRRRALITAALLSIPIVPLWAFSHSVAILAAAGFAMQFMVQGCWGVIPAHLNELSPGEARGTFPGFVYQLGNFLASTNATIQGVLAAACGGDFSYALAGVAIAAALAIALFASLGTEARDIDMKVAGN